MATIHETAIIHDNATLGDAVTVGPYACIEDNVRIGARCNIAAHAIVRKGTELGEDVFVDNFAVLGAAPQSLACDPHIESGVKIGARTIIREGVTIHRASQVGGYTQVGHNCFIMTYAHIGHDCTIEDNVIVTSGVLLGGHVHIASHCNIGGNAVVHQFVRFGEGVMAAGGGRFSMDAPPFCIITEANRLRGLNLTGLKRRQFSREAIADIKNCFRTILGTPGNPFKHAITYRKQGLVETEHGGRFLAFFEHRGPRSCMQWHPLNRAEVLNSK